MKLWPRLLLFSLAVLVPLRGEAKVPPDKVLKTFKVVDGLEIQLWASEPLFVNPTCMDIDHKGRVWVCESVNYRNKLSRKPKLNRPAGDRIVILEDSKGTGKADKATTFYQSPDLLAPLGIAVAKDPVGPGYKVFVCQSPDILVFTDSKGRGKADGPPKKLLSGFGGFDHDHGVHGILIGPDMKLYFTVGDTGVHGLRSSDKTGRIWRSNNTDCRAGTTWRCNLDGTGLELIAHNFRNHYEPCVDSFGTVFVSDNDDDGQDQTRICYVMPGGNYGYHPRGRGETHWHEEQPGVVPKLLRTFRGSPTGMCVYEGTLLPKKYQGQLLHTDASPRQLRAYFLKPAGASYAIEREDMVNSSDNWFRPSDVCVAPDGSVFIADWYDPGVGGHGMGDIEHGRIYRVAPKGNKPSVPKVDLSTNAGLKAALGSPALSVRYMAMAKIQGTDWPEARELARFLGKIVGDPKEPDWLRARAWWQAALLSERDRRNWIGREGAIAILLLGKDERFRCLALRILKDVHRTSPAHLPDEQFKKDLVADPSPAVRREALLLLRDVDPAKAKPLIYELAKKYDGKDRFYLAAVGIAVGHHDKARRDVILADFAKHFPTWDDRVAGLVWELRPPKVLPILEKYLADERVPAEKRARIVDILAGSQEKGAGLTVLKLLTNGAPAEVRERAIENLKLFLPGKWQYLKSSPEFDRAVRPMLGKVEAKPAGLALIAAAAKVELLPEVRKLASAKDEKEPIRRAAIQALAKLPATGAVEALRPLLATEPVALRYEAALSLGYLARHTEGEARETALKALQGVVLDGKSELALRQSAVAGLAASRPGALWLLGLHAKGKLPEALRAEAGRLLRSSVYKDIQNRALAAFPAPGKLDPKRLPPIAVLASRRGDAKRGKALMAASLKSNLQCMKCHSVRGTGGQVGPDLSMIGKKASRENLFESILYPSKAIADQYLTWIVETKRGLSLSGLIVEEAPTHIILRDAEGRDTRVAKKDIEMRTKGPRSLMPEDLVAYMSASELVDIVEYLIGLTTPALGLDYWHIVGPFDNGTGMEGLDRVFPPEKGIDLKATYAGKKGKVGWRTVRPGAGGYVDLQAFFAGESDNIVSYLTREVVSPVDQEATILTGTDDGAKLWINDTLVFTSRATRAAAPEQDTVRVKLKKGTNRIVLKINNGNGAHGFYFTILSEQELKPVGKK
jgi:putative membrane-bound dehydrogenase-like protein